MNDICQECVSRLLNCQPLGVSETWAEPDNFVITSATALQLQSSAVNGCKLCDLHLQKLVKKGYLTYIETEGSPAITVDDPLREFVLSLQIFAKESVELYDVVRLIVDGTPFDLYTVPSEYKRFERYI
jgi:hypothetical protein